jgi:hypothetical protein
MTRKWMAINLLLLVVTGLLGWRLYLSVVRFDADNDLAKIRPVLDMKQKIVPEKALPKLPAKKDLIPAEFAIIPEKNVFSESRSREEKSEAVVQPETPPLTQKPILVGINITDKQQTALIIDPAAAPQDRSRRAQIKRIGDVFHGYTITSIEPDRIVLESGAQKEIIPLHEGSKKAQAGKTPILSTRVVSFGGGNVSGGSPVAVSSGSVAASGRTTGMPASIPGSAARTTVAPIASPPVAAASSSGSVRQVASPNAPQQGAQMPQRIQTLQQSPGNGSGSPPTRVIRTPFGDIVRPAGD